MKPARTIRVEGEVAYVPLTQGLEAVIDASDVGLVDGCLWAAVRRGQKVYAGRSVWRDGTNDVVLMHRVIASAKAGELVDHRDGNGLVNRRLNLRVATRSQNAMNSSAHCDNSSGIKGVHWSKAHEKWKAEICSNGKRKHLGLFESQNDAACAYAEAAQRLHGEFARTA